ncbi:hypothetical protein CBR_g12232 [Chara braunii]|uniref:Micro-fibrillar-associated protein 1 C-terminal domain-containing protein n=1 Tax=Chara braunii TaxID=69332 RepID=A0A388KRJ6_CHABU|nr:hypothetical protein CBR_g12232 [Chara braunii]|eukprot:GBG72659.1 hypothetical protein CBR_g12232 [Chara braunii]
MSVAAGVTEAALAVREKLRLRQVKVKRYWPGKAPEWAVEVEEEEDLTVAIPAAGEKGAAGEKPKLKTDDPRLRRIAESRREREEAIARHRQIRAAEVVSTREDDERRALAAARRGYASEEEDEEDEEEEDDEEIEARRARIRARLLARQKDEELPPEEEEEDEEDEEEGSEYETDSEEEYAGVAMVKPVFVPRGERETIAERERLEQQEAALLEAAKKRLEVRKVETKQIVVEEIRKEEEVERNKGEDGDGAEVITDDDINEAEEYEMWKQREMRRIKRDREEREMAAKSKEELEKIRNMTEEERREYERRNPKQSSAPKKKWKFMQKYYHKGAFFQAPTDDKFGTAGTDDIFHRDFSSPTGEDKMDKTILPRVMQVKHFGRSGRTKWTHLVAEDTTQWDNPWTYNDPLRVKYNNKMAGMNRPIAKPAGNKKLKEWGDDSVET